MTDKAKRVEEAFAGLYNSYINDASRFEEDDVLGASHFAFIKGIKFAQQWINVKEELPKSNIKCLVKDEYGNINMALFYHGRFEFANIGERGSFSYCFVSKTALKRASNLLNQYATHWRPIKLELQ
jgi:hypothetical protein